ncbi:Threonine--tRNA ligase [Rickettsiales bacterium Ac37b]|nr:Threonine--tRNA ligase [Rickettsiales bacterium Ac37b]
MFTITFPDGTIREFSQTITGLDLAKNISTSLAKIAIALKVNGQMVDLSYNINENATIQIITIKDSEALEIIRHDAAHLMAEAVKELYPETQITIGPVIENGFYYDFARNTPFTPEDLIFIEKRMHEIVKRNENIIREVWDRNEAIEFFKSQGENYKAEIINAIPEGEKISLYKQGNFIDLCRGPHAPSTSYIKHFKLMKLAGAYWRGDSKNAMLQRIYGTAWTSEIELNEYLHRLEEAEKRDHRKLGRDLDLFHLQEEAPGMIFWHNKGWTLYLIIENYIRNKIRQHGYIEVKTPILVNKSLWEASGHWEKFREAMFTSKAEEQVMALKPMNCPCHIQIFKQGIKSYRDLPIRMAEFGACHRNESSGSLHGIMRVRGFVQDDAHIFCTEDMITEETVKFCALLKNVYKDFGFNEIKVKFSDRPAIRAGSDEVWDKAELSLKNAVNASGLEYTLNPGEGAFYGPKLEFVLKDAIGRDWQCGTLQVDFILPERLGATYIGQDGNKHHPVMIHRAILGTLERFIGILIEEHTGNFPLWLAPIQVMILTITNDADEYAESLKTKFDGLGIRSSIDTSSEKISYKIRQHSLTKIPLLAVIGKREQEQSTLSIRFFGSENQQNMTIEEFINYIKNKTQLSD